MLADMDKDLLTVKETAEILRISEQHIYNTTRRRAKGFSFPIKPVRIGKNVRFRKKDVEEFINS
jgi:excisionase family DNA binding protein